MSKVNLAKIEAIWREVVAAPCRYVWGAKPPLQALPGYVKQCDGSGMSRYLIARSTNDAWVWPEGSDEQFQKLRRELPLVHYSEVGSADPGRLFVAFIHPFMTEAGHVWLVAGSKGQDGPTTMECHGGGGAVPRRWNNKTLLERVAACYELATEPGNLKPFDAGEHGGE